MQPIKDQILNLEQIVENLLTEAKNLGADAAEAAVSQNIGLDVNVRLGQVETIEHTRDRNLGITVYFGTRKGSASTTDLSAAAIRDACSAACKIANYTQNDPYAGLAPKELMAQNPKDLDLYHPWALEVDAAIELALECEDAARAVDPRITNSEGASLSSHEGSFVYGNSHGFIGGFPISQHSLGCGVLAQEEDSMQQGYWWSSKRAAVDLEAPADVGRKAAQRAIARLGARQINTCVAPVVFQAEVATGLLHNFISAISGPALYRKASFLLDKLGQPIFPQFVHIHENPHLPRALGSAPFDNEGVITTPKDLITNGILQTYCLDSYSARKLGRETTGNAGGVHNLIIDSSNLDQQELLQALGTGLWVTELLGTGVNLVTGDYSRGVAGFWVENGEIVYPVEEVTVASNLQDIFLGLQAVGSDVDTRSNIHTGSWLMAPMTIAGA